ncbi:aspartyl/glutamyl-tRNA(asn/gln) amidotransferase, a subunit [Heliomicrobium modesticaldum Ice1]|uniref:Glutamyl-tRNA(Gln) amidotransferase subunit A n=1 Tax=Heliobacterium modesticaldum (strain ATCC 51547 / Ice1) TaxID=498761 RepID=GATA_HELMI|nr:Asp-tRNA(Asn)/Glu-tRNA(Gln) amidotransferase subunit GatA [Heliomicrobium modesticaldum]B0TDK7.1 RecName: Full=Glutamyl-tRNA(Gln) amidotransferase subunit A; Short=Glu-ADT subunit A [Heliomicrobium modesticaldum Ice1]ABZ85532.1 aspartyl/glutamyl-tRNA(asn/gln) amidotransferase, a subunit [Heliomicrobium modesticaldum Ice1]
MKLYTKTAHELHDLLVRKEVSATEIVKTQADRMQALEPKIRAFVTLTVDKALEQAARVDAKIAAGEAIGPLEGIPMAIKDNMCTDGVRTTCSSKILNNFVPPYDATVVTKLKEAGAVMMGKTNLDEFAMGSSTENSGFFATCNPWDIERVPGGSSGGSAASVAAGQAVFSLGSDTGGSIRQPAAFCGVVGLKPTYGAVSRFGLIAFASSLDQIGPFTRDVRDCAHVMNAIAGHDAKDSTSAPVDYPDYTSLLGKPIKGWRVGLPKEYFGDGMDPEVKEVIEKAVKTIEDLGAEVAECSLPHTEYALPVYYLIAPAEASSNLARYDGVRYGYRSESADDLITMFKKTRAEGFGDEVKRRIMLGTYALSSGYYDAYYLKALKVRTLIKNDFDQAFEKFDVILSPTTPTVAFKFGDRTDNPLQMYLSDIYTLSVNLAGIPGLSINAGFAKGMPVGLQIIGKPFDEARLLQIAYAYEEATGCHSKMPDLGV